MTSSTHTRSLVSDIRNRYIVALLIIALLSIGAQVIIQIYLSANESDSTVINLAGRQRMLSQRISKDVFAITSGASQNPTFYLEQLESSLQVWQRAHIGLQQGDAELGLPGNNSPEVAELFRQLEPYFDGMFNASTCALQIIKGENPSPRCPDRGMPRLEQVILENEAQFLPLMDEIVFQYDKEADARLESLRLLELGVLGLTLLTLTAEVFLIFRPTVQNLRSTLTALDSAQTELQQSNVNLEKRVEERTQELANTNRELQVANSEIQNYVHVVSHDLRSPIAGIKGFTRELRMSLDDLKTATPATSDSIYSDMMDALDILDLSNDRMERMTKNLLQLAREGLRELVIEPLNTGELVGDILKTFTPQLQEKKIQVEVGQLPTVQADKQVLEQIVANLISNAIKFQEKDNTGKIEITANEDPQGVTLIVRDNGRGIAKNEHDKIMQLFRRAGEQNTEGEGVGLYYSNNMLKRLGGKLWFESEENVGTTFHVSLPKSS
jgi:signal transduction histidine kinase